MNDKEYIKTAYLALEQAVAEFDHHGICQDNRATNGKNQAIEAMTEIEQTCPWVKDWLLEGETQ